MQTQTTEQTCPAVTEALASAVHGTEREGFFWLQQMEKKFVKEKQHRTMDAECSITDVLVRHRRQRCWSRIRQQETGRMLGSSVRPAVKTERIRFGSYLWEDSMKSARI